MDKYEKTTIGKGTKKERKVPQRYIPKSLSAEDKKKQERSLLKKEKRPKLKSFESKPSPFVERFKKKYGVNIDNKKFINDNIITYAGQKKILDKGMAAYFGSGSRPNQTAASWSKARLASVIMYGAAYKVDKAIAEKHGRPKWLSGVPKKFK
jgi:hypothetical protein|tara:strand:- start:466 stop:921 length:456 start_codon:yes stop_codon:yes gene_type:complete